MSFLPNPLHPAIVHLPIALAVLVPLFAIGALWAIRRGAKSRAAWSVPVAMLGLLLLSGWAALQTGEQGEEPVERVVGEAAIETHEESAERFMVATGVVMLLATAGFVGGRTGSISRAATGVASVLLLGAGYQVGHSGGALVYRDGAPIAMAAPSNSPTGSASGAVVQSVRTDDDDERRR